MYCIGCLGNPLYLSPAIFIGVLLELDFICKYLYTQNWSDRLSCSRDLTLYTTIFIPDPPFGDVQFFILIDI